MECKFSEMLNEVDFHIVYELTKSYLAKRFSMLKLTNVKRSDYGSSAHPQAFFKRSVLKTNEFKIYVKVCLLDLIFSLFKKSLTK